MHTPGNTKKEHEHPRTPQLTPIMTVPKMSQLRPGVGVNIVLKADQRSGRLTSGSISEVDTLCQTTLRGETFYTGAEGLMPIRAVSLLGCLPDKRDR